MALKIRQKALNPPPPPPNYQFEWPQFWFDIGVQRVYEK